jgi:hypothetical protein
LGKEINLTALNAKVVPEGPLVAEFARVLEKYPPTAIESAFRRWRYSSQYFPTVSEVLDLIQAWQRAEREEREAEERKQEKLRTEQARARGELVDFADVRDLCRKVAAKVQGPVPSVEQMVKPMVGPKAKRSSPLPPELTPERKAELRRQLDEELSKRR